MMYDVLRSGVDGRLSFDCEGCGMSHSVMTGVGSGPRWSWNGSMENPTFTPSVLVTWSEPSDNPDEFDDPSKDIKKVCHSFVTDGVIQYLSDCTHHLAGKSVPLKAVENPDDNA